jgi:decaprenylphospho-beta-D-erythro-pentofuranosid-2-ulose 2-reductase
MSDGLGRPATALVIGAGSDIAAATLRRLAGDGLRRVALAAREPDRLGVADELRAAGVETRGLPFDAVQLDRHQALVDEAFAWLGDVDLVLVCVGLLGGGDPLDRRQVVDVFQANTLGPASLIAAAAGRLTAQGHGLVAVLSSVAGQRVRRVNPAYGGAKAGIDGFCEALGDRLRGTGVRVMVVRPGFVRTKMTAGMRESPMATDADVVAAAIVSGIRSGAETVWVPGRMRAVAAVLRLLPRPVFRRISR